MKKLSAFISVIFFSFILTACDSSKSNTQKKCLPKQQYHDALLRCHAISDINERKDCARKLDGVASCDDEQYMKLHH